ncbi:molecular chaperone GrpE [Pullulanibacillus pueri]|uniref:Protein GrpE n=1 Tax=Pullulanibacillus pueri TaxID=1437324 RepID=A0A8J3EMZ3_9BACL|nr:nucleotide exchange factor GrpE [Pullulanibacillus pueri]MBM7683060.1 molecular chaperone GrpE [Pullulanibacillus pueri]GGH84928.1 protein GrpE [Pullulanibacillus pueri]
MSEKDLHEEVVEKEEGNAQEDDSLVETDTSEEREVENRQSEDNEALHNEENNDNDEQNHLVEQIAQLEAEKTELNNRLLRVQADYENFKRRVREEKAKDRQFRAQTLVEDLLPVADNFSRALQSDVETEDAKSLKQGVEMVYRQLVDALTKEGVEEIDGLNQPFDPNEQQAVMQDESPDHEPNTVIQVLQKGYKLNGRVLRPAMVKVSS